MCDTGYSITGQYHTRTCGGDGSSPNGIWSEVAPECPRKLIIHYNIIEIIHKYIHACACSCELWKSSTIAYQ